MHVKENKIKIQAFSVFMIFFFCLFLSTILTGGVVHEKGLLAQDCKWEISTYAIILNFVYANW